MTFDHSTWLLTSLTYKGTPIASLTQVWFQSDFNFSKETQITRTNIFHVTWCQMTLDFVMWPLTSLTYEGTPFASSKVLWSNFQLFKGDSNNENLTKLEHTYTYEGHSVSSEIRCVSAIAYLLAESWCCLYKAPTFISHNTKETIS